MRYLTATILALFAYTSAPHAQQIHIVHCLQGCPAGAPTGNDTVVREIYALSSNPNTKFADWVAYRVTRETIGSSESLERDWEPDPALPASETLEAADYTGAHAAHGYDRGHQAPLASFAGTVFWRTTNMLSNITPQMSGLNRGPWARLESAVRHAAYHHNELYVVTGPLFGTPASPTLPNADETHIVPTGYWKVVSTRGGAMTAFIFGQSTAQGANYCSHIRSLADVETESSLDLFPDATGWPTGNLNTDLGC